MSLITCKLASLVLPSPVPHMCHFAHSWSFFTVMWAQYTGGGRRDMGHHHKYDTLLKDHVSCKM